MANPFSSIMHDTFFPYNKIDPYYMY